MSKRRVYIDKRKFDIIPKNDRPRSKDRTGEIYSTGVWRDGEEVKILVLGYVGNKSWMMSDGIGYFIWDTSTLNRAYRKNLDLYEERMNKVSNMVIKDRLDFAC